MVESRKKYSTPEYDQKQNLTTWYWTGPIFGGLASPGWTAITRNMAIEPATDMLVSNTHAKKYKQTIFQPIKTLKKKHWTNVTRWNQFTICWPETVGASDRKLSISQTKWFNRTYSQLAFTKIRVNKAHNVPVLHSRVMGRTLLPLQTQLLPYLTPLSTLICTRSCLNVGYVPFGPRTCTCDSSQLVINPPTRCKPMINNPRTTTINANSCTREIRCSWSSDQVSTLNSALALGRTLAPECRPIWVRTVMPQTWQG